MNGIVLVNKPSGMTSHDVVSRARRILKMKKIGHAGTLDPMATGLLVLLVGKGTKLFDAFVGFDKSYRATMRLGVRTHSADIQGNVLEEKPIEGITQEQVEEAMAGFKGVIEQVPPMVSAVKHKGKRLYKLARQGQEVERKPRRIRIDALDIENFAPPDVTFFLACSKGTYVRQIAEDVGQVLGCGACISQIERTRVGPFSLDEAVELNHIKPEDVRDWKPDAAVRSSEGANL